MGARRKDSRREARGSKMRGSTRDSERGSTRSVDAERTGHKGRSGKRASGSRGPSGEPGTGERAEVEPSAAPVFPVVGIGGSVGSLSARGLEAALQEAKAALGRSEARYRRLYDSAPVGYLALEGPETIADTNRTATRLLGIPRTQLVGRQFSEFVAPDDQNEWFLRRREAAGGGGPLTFELGLQKKVGKTLRAEVVLSSSRPEEDASQTLSVALVDVSDLWRAQAALREAAMREVMAEQRERRRLADALHDDLGQTLSLLSMKLAALADGPWPEERAHQLFDLSTLAAEAHRKVRSLSFQLSPSILYDVGLVAASEWLAQELKDRYGLRVEVAKAEEIEALDEVARAVLYRALREFLVNVAKHAATDRARVRIWRQDEHACVEVEDEGVGFHHDSVRHGFGLLSLRHRVRELGGRIEVVTNPGDGTRATICLPLRVSDGDGAPRAAR